MPGKRLYDSSLTRTTFAQAMIDSQELAEMLVDWDGLSEGRPIPLKLVGNSRSQGSDDNITYSDEILATHSYIRLSADGGANWIVFKMSACDGSETPVAHDVVTLGAPNGGLSITGQVLTLLPATTTSAGSLSAIDKIKVDNFGGYTMASVGAGESIFRDIVNNEFKLKSLTHGTRISLTSSTDEILIDLDNVPDEIMSAVTTSLVYADTATLIAGQGTQTAGQFYQVGTGAFYKYIGTTIGDITDYTALVDPSIQQNVFSITLPSSDSVQGRINLATVGDDYPTDWGLTTGISSKNLVITHNLGRRIAHVNVFSFTDVDDTQLKIGSAGYTGLYDYGKNSIEIQSLATVEDRLLIELIFN